MRNDRFITCVPHFSQEMLWSELCPATDNDSLFWTVYRTHTLPCSTHYFLCSGTESLLKMCFVCDKIWKIVEEEKRIPQGFGFEPFLRRIVEKFENFNEENVSKVSVFTVLRESETGHHNEVIIGIATEHYNDQLDSSRWSTPNACGGFTVVDTKGQLVAWKERTRRGIFIDPDWEDWIQVVWTRRWRRSRNVKTFG